MGKQYLFILTLIVLTGCNAVTSDGAVQQSVTENLEIEGGDSQTQYGPEGTDVQQGNVLVYVTAGVSQCEYRGKPTAETAQLLIDHGIDVVSSHCATTDLAFMSVCGSATGDINLHEINARNVSAAQDIGFGPVSELKETGIGYTINQCDRDSF